MKAINSTTIVSGLISELLKNKFSRNLFRPKLDRYIRENIFKNSISKNPEFVKLYPYYALRAMYMSYFRNYDKGFISSKVTNKVLKTLVESSMVGDKEALKSREKFQSKYGLAAPSFITISPTKKCNLNCVGCYASSTARDAETLSWALVNKIIEDAYSNMGMRFFVISGGEPLMYKSENKTILDLVKKWSDCFFLMYTNGTLINDETASRIAEAGNLTPAISVEGYEAETDKRRGKGVYQKIIKAKNNLIKYGVPFGLSVTATKENINALLDEGFFKYYFDEFGATYMWVFHYMPIGRKFTTDLMITPRQRVELFKIQNKILIDDQAFVADFWNSAIFSTGCISSGRHGGYFYINWDGNIMPCVFVPHYIDNVNSIYSSGKTLSDAMFSPLFVEGRKWQENYAYGKDKMGNLLMPCFYRDHYKNFFEIAKRTGAKPENQSADKALNSKEYYDAMLKFDEELDKLSSPVWDELAGTSILHKGGKKHRHQKLYRKMSHEVSS